MSLFLYTHMHKNSVPPNNFTFPFILKPLSDLEDLRNGESIHTHIVKLGQFNDIYVQNSLLNLYASCGCMKLCQQMFDEMPKRDVVSWTVLIDGNRVLGKYDDALIAFEQMQYEGVIPNRVTMVNALEACANSGAIEMGVWIHDFIRKKGWELDVIMGTALVDMYGKCGRIEEGIRVFERMEVKSVFTWNSLINGLANAKSGNEAVWWFFRMEQVGVEVDEVTLLGVLCACCNSGLVETGWQIFSLLMKGKYGFPPNVKHCACMVNLLARAGQLEHAVKFINSLTYEPTRVMWGVLLAGCRAHGNLELSEFAAKKLVDLEPENGAYHVLLSNLYAEMGKWTDVIELRRLMRSKGVTKDLGYSSVAFDNQDDELSASIS